MLPKYADRLDREHEYVRGTGSRRVDPLAIQRIHGRSKYSRQTFDVTVRRSWKSWVTALKKSSKVALIGTEKVWFMSHYHRTGAFFANIELQTFCRLINALGFHWVWSDTCCLDKDNVVLQELPVAMFTSYRSSSHTPSTSVVSRPTPSGLAISVEVSGIRVH